jgi:hypothetical protein
MAEVKVGNLLDQVAPAMVRRASRLLRSVIGKRLLAEKSDCVQLFFIGHVFSSLSLVAWDVISTVR